MIHYYKLLGKNIVLDVFSGAVHVLDDVAYDVVAYFGQDFVREQACPAGLLEALGSKYGEAAVRGAYEEICGLYDAELLYTTDIYEEYAKNIEKNSVVKAMCLHIAHDCNLRCKYCFADTGSFHHGRSSGKRRSTLLSKTPASGKTLRLTISAASR